MRNTLRDVVLGLAVVTLGAGSLWAAGDPEPWVAPARMAKKANPIAADSASVAAGKKVFEKECMSCHGAKGKGDGPKAGTLDRNPGDLSLPKVQQQTDGAIFWKVSEGRAPMPATKALLSEDQRWQVVNYVRTLGTEAVVEPKFAANDTLRGAVSTVYAAYSNVRTALCGDGKLAITALQESAKAGAGASVEPLTAEGRAAWSASFKTLTTAVDSLAAAGDDKAKARLAFAPVSEAVGRMLEQFGHAEATNVLVYSHASTGGTWLQTDAKALDPYGATAEPPALVRQIAAQRKAGH